MKELIDNEPYNEGVTSPGSMPTLKRWLFRVVLIVVLMIGILFIVPWVLPSSISGYVIETALAVLSGKNVSIDGDAEFSLLPVLNVRAGKISFSEINADPNDEKPAIAEAAEIGLEIETLGLLAGEMNIKSVVLVRPRIRLTEIIKPPAVPDSSSILVQKAKQNWGWWRSFSVGEVRVENASVAYVNVSGETAVRVSELQLSNENSNNLASGTKITGRGKINGVDVDVLFSLDKVVVLGTGAGVPMMASVRAKNMDVDFTGTLSKRQDIVGKGIVSVKADDWGRVATVFGWELLKIFTGKLDFKSEYAFSGERFSLNNVNLEIGSNIISGDMAILKTGAVVTGAFETEHLDLGEDFMAGTMDGVFGNLLKWSGERLRSWAPGSEVSLKWSTLKWDAIRFGSGTLALTRTEKQPGLEYRLENMKTYAGETSFRVGFSEAKSIYALQGKLSMQRFNLGPLIKGLSGKALLSGQGNLSLSLLSVGRTFGQLVSALTGTGSFNIINGQIPESAMTAKLLQQEKTNGEQYFSQFLGNLTFRQGIVASDDLLLKAPELSIIGEGELDLTDRKIDVRLQSLTVKPGTKTRSVKPFAITGTLSDFSFQEQ